MDLLIKIGGIVRYGKMFTKKKNSNEQINKRHCNPLHSLLCPESKIMSKLVGGGNMLYLSEGPFF